MTKQRFASLTAGLLARKGEAAPPVALFNKAQTQSHTDSPAQFEDVSPEMQERIDSIVKSPEAPSNWTHPPLLVDPTGPPSLDLETEYGMDDQRGNSEAAASGRAFGVSSKAADRSGDNTLFSRMTPMVTPQFGRRKESSVAETNRTVVSMRPKKNPQDVQKEKNEARTLIVSRARAPSIRRTAITLRLDEARYLRLKYAGAHLGKTSQSILESALDDYLASLGDEFTHDADWLRQSVSIIKSGKRQ